jgi:hypothetical protein
MERFFSLTTAGILAAALLGTTGCKEKSAIAPANQDAPGPVTAAAGTSRPAAAQELPPASDLHVSDLEVSADRQPGLIEEPSRQTGSALSPSSAAAASPSAASPSAASPSAATSAATQEHWYSFYLNGGKIGYSHYRTRPELHGEQWLVRTVLEQQISLLRDGDQVTQQLTLESLETAAGQVWQLRSRVSDGVTAVVTTGRIVDGRMQITLEASGNTQSQTIDWDPGWRGFFAPEQLLQAQPLQAGQSHAGVAFLPVLNVVARISLQAEDWEDVDTPFGREKLLRIRSVAAAPQLTLESLLWCNAAGEIRRHYTPQAHITAHRTVKELALVENDQVDLYEAINIRVPHPLADPHHTQRAVYHARLTGSSDPRHVFVNDLSQRVQSRGDREVEIEVLAIRPDFPLQIDMPQSSPEAADLAANSLIQSDDPQIVRMAQSVAPQESDAWRWALACEQYVSRTIERKNLSQAFSSASEVAQLKAGDCTEHAVLTAALCRARGIPARVVTGLVSVNDFFAFHMWNEVWIEDRWIAIDATLGRGGIGAGHLKLGVSSLQGVSPFAALAPVLEVMGSLELDVVSAR